MQIYIARNGTQIGPFSEEQLRGMLAGGLATPTDLAWREGALDWQPVHTFLRLQQPPPIPRAPLTTLPTTAGPQSAGPTGVGGWLVFFCVGLTIISPLKAIPGMLSSWEQAKPAFDSFPSLRAGILWENLGLTALVIYGFIVGCIIWNGSPKGRDLAKKFLLIRLTGFIVIEIIAFLLISDLPAKAVQGGIDDALGELFLEAIFFAIWWFYFKKSKRVKNTYGDNGES